MVCPDFFLAGCAGESSNGSPPADTPQAPLQEGEASSDAPPAVDTPEVILREAEESLSDPPPVDAPSVAFREGGLAGVRIWQLPDAPGGHIGSNK
ncbi:MAG: hypothetical protein AAF614_19905 [Chloroflexota bacterium]